MNTSLGTGIVIEDVLFEETLLGISRLIGPSKSGGKSNLTLQRLTPLCEDNIRDQIHTLVGKAVNAGEFANDWRNRHIAHRDLDFALGKPAKILEAATVEKYKCRYRRYAMFEMPSSMNTAKAQ